MAWKYTRLMDKSHPFNTLFAYLVTCVNKEKGAHLPPKNVDKILSHIEHIEEENKKLQISIKQICIASFNSDNITYKFKATIRNKKTNDIVLEHLYTNRDLYSLWKNCGFANKEIEDHITRLLNDGYTFFETEHQVYSVSKE